MSVKLRSGQIGITDLAGFYARVVEYEVPDRGDGDELIALVTNVIDPSDLNAVDLATAYHERWEVELVVGEPKTHQRGSAVILRSRKPDLVKQEVWGAVAHSLRNPPPHARGGRPSRSRSRPDLVHPLPPYGPPSGLEPGGFFPSAARGEDR